MTAAPHTIVRATGRVAIDVRDAAEDPAAHRRRACGGPERCTACRMFKGLGDARDVAVRAINVATRLLVRLDARVVDRSLVLRGRAPKGDEWKDFDYAELISILREVAPGSDPSAELVDKVAKEPPRPVYLYPLLKHIAGKTLSGGVCSALARKAEQRWKTYRWEALVAERRSPPHYRRTMPLPVRAQDMRVRSLDHGRYEVSFTVGPGRHPGGAEYRVPVLPRDRYQREMLRALATRSVRPGELQIEQDRLRPAKWYLRIAYTKIVEPLPPGVARLGAVNRGIFCFLCAVTAEGEQWMYDADDIEAYLLQIQSRRKKYQRQLRSSMRGGHGRTRSLQPIERLSGKAERWRETRCQTLARQFAKWFRDQGVTLVRMEDFEGIRDGLPENLEGGKFVWDRIQTWPYYQLGMRLRSCLEEYGIAVEVVPAYHISQKCPHCGHTAEENRSIKLHHFKCVECGFRRHLDVAAAMNVLGREKPQDGENGAPAGNGKPKRKNGHRKK